ncbi:MAG: glycosyltransferase [Cyclobacteriaceae bacterium]
MIVSLILLAGFLILVLLSDLVLLLQWARLSEPATVDTKDLPMVSILLAVRNEEANLPRCLQQLINLKYPKEKLEILVGDDDSSDLTLSLAQQWAKDNDQIKVFSIIETLPKVKAKANVIAQLARKSKGEYLFITDADVAVNPKWITSLLSYQAPSIGAVGGTTLIEGSNLWAAWQNLDWLLAQGMLQVANRMGFGIAISGTNMMVTRKAYQSIGGFEEIPHAVTEDFGILTAVKFKGFKIRNVLQSMAVVKALPSPSVWMLVSQRKRWMLGATKLSWPVLALLYLRGLFWPFILTLWFFFPWWAVIFGLLKFCLAPTFLYQIIRKAGQPVNWLAWLSFEGYSAVLSLATMIVHWLPYKVTWKERKY